MASQQVARGTGVDLSNLRLNCFCDTIDQNFFWARITNNSMFDWFKLASRVRQTMIGME